MSLIPNKEIVAIPKLPLVVETAGGGWGGWPARVAAVAVLLLYAYLLVYVKTNFLRNQRLELISKAMMKTMMMSEHLYAKDQKLSANIQQLLHHSDQ